MALTWTASSVPAPRLPTRWPNGSAARPATGFVLAATHMPGAFEDVVRMVVPELHRRGLFRTRYEGSTLREHLGLSRPEALGRVAAVS